MFSAVDLLTTYPSGSSFGKLDSLPFSSITLDSDTTLIAMEVFRPARMEDLEAFGQKVVVRLAAPLS